MEGKEEYEMRLARQMRARVHRERKKGTECMSQCMETSPFIGSGVLVTHNVWDKETQSCDCTGRHDQVRDHFLVMLRKLFLSRLVVSH